MTKPRFFVSQIDSSTHAPIGISQEHHEIHSGDMFHAHVNSSASDFDNTDELYLTFNTPNTDKEQHCEFEVTVTGACEFKFLEGPTIAAGSGTERVAANHNRRSTKTATILSNEGSPQVGEYTYEEAATGRISADGTVLIGHTIGAGKDKVSGDSRGGEWILKKDTLYAFALIAQADNIRANIDVQFYEHTPKE